MGRFDPDDADGPEGNRRQCRVGSRVLLKAGGDFCFRPQPSEPPQPLLLLAGGVGINPLVSVLRHCRHLRGERRRTGAGYVPGAVRLLYSARGHQQLLFEVRYGQRDRVLAAGGSLTGNRVERKRLFGYCDYRGSPGWLIDDSYFFFRLIDKKLF